MANLEHVQYVGGHNVKVVLAGGTGQVGCLLQRHFAGHEVVVLSRSSGALWDGRTLGPWARELEGADVVVNLAGRSVSCRYTQDNLDEMLRSRVDSAAVIGEAIAAATRPPKVWLQMSTATIYADRRDAPNDEATGVIGGAEKGVPDYWAFSVRIAREWEEACFSADLPATRRVAMRAAMVMTPDRGGVFDVLSWMTRLGLGGPVAGGGQWVSWIADVDFTRAVDFIVASDLEGPVNVCSPAPVTQRELMRALRRAWHVPIGLPATRSMASLGAWVLRTDTELLLKSRRVVPGRLLDAGFGFEQPSWTDAAEDLVRRARA
jgi:uncharacterized protein (TIGR01777 family)